MQSRVAIVFLAGLALTLASPVNQKSEHDIPEVVIVPLESQLINSDDDVGFLGGFSSFDPFSSYVSNLWQRMDEMLRRMTQLIHGLPTEDDAKWTDFADGKGNTTSTTKVINGHKVTINETTYSNQGDNSGSVFKIRIVDVHPTSEEDASSEKEPDSVSNRNKDVEEITSKSEIMDKGSPEIEESANEIPQGKPEIYSNSNEEIENFDNIPNENLQIETLDNTKKATNLEMIASNEVDIPPLPDIETNDVNNYHYDLTNDTYINDLLAQSGAPHNPDAELIVPIKSASEFAEEPLVNKNLNRDVDQGEKLSHLYYDTLINQDGKFDSNAEVINIDERIPIIASNEFNNDNDKYDIDTLVISPDEKISILKHDTLVNEGENVREEEAENFQNEDSELIESLIIK